MFGTNHFVNEVVWCRSDGNATGNRFRAKHDTLFWYCKQTYIYSYIYIPYGPGTIFRKDDTGREFYVGNQGKVYYRDIGRPSPDWWVINTNTSKGKYPTQKPEALLERIIKASSEES